MSGVQSGKVMPRVHTRFEKARILGARALQISMGAPLYVSEEELREKFMHEACPTLRNRGGKNEIRLGPSKNSHARIRI